MIYLIHVMTFNRGHFVNTEKDQNALSGQSGRGLCLGIIEIKNKYYSTLYYYYYVILLKSNIPILCKNLLVETKKGQNVPSD